MNTPSYPFIPCSEMSDEQQSKALFVAECMEPLFRRATRQWVEGMRYVVNAETSEEFVWVEVAGEVMLRTNVTADSEWAMVKDVLARLAESYE